MKRRSNKKTSEIICFIKTKTGKFHQVCLDKDSQAAVLKVITFLHDGKIKCFETKFPFEEKQKEPNP